MNRTLANLSADRLQRLVVAWRDLCRVFEQSRGEVIAAYACGPNPGAAGHVFADLMAADLVEIVRDGHGHHWALKHARRRVEAN